MSLSEVLKNCCKCIGWVIYWSVYISVKLVEYTFKGLVKLFVTPILIGLQLAEIACQGLLMLFHGCLKIIRLLIRGFQWIDSNPMPFVFFILAVSLVIVFFKIRYSHN